MATAAVLAAPVQGAALGVVVPLLVVVVVQQEQQQQQRVQRAWCHMGRPTGCYAG
jgi:hypothetical protein